MPLRLGFRHASDDHLTSPDTVDAWLGTLASREPLVMLEAVNELLRTESSDGHKVTPFRLGALFHLDLRLQPMLDSLSRQQAGLPTLPRTIHTRSWYVQYDLAEAFIATYERLVGALLGVDDPQLRPCLPMLIARMLRHMFEQAQLRLFRYEQWIPAKLCALHRLYQIAADTDILRAPVTMMSRAQVPTATTIEHEYVQNLALLRLGSGNMSPRQITIAANFLSLWADALTLRAERPQTPAFEVDLHSTQGLRPRGAEPSSGRGLRYWDPSPLLEAIRQRQQGLQSARAPESEAAFRREQLDVLRHLLHFWSADDIKKRPRRSNALSQPLLVVTGFAPIRNALEYWERSGRLPIPGEDLDRHYEYSVNGLSGSYQASDVRDGKGAMDPDPPRLEGISTWRLLDQSESGFRLAAPIQEGATLPMGTLVALAISSEDWVIALIRRIRKVSSTQAEYGVERLGSHARPITLRATTQEWLTRPANARRDRDLGPPMRGLLLGSGNREADFREQALILPAEGFIPKAMRWMCAADRSSVVRLSIALAGGPEWTWTGFDEIGTVAPTS